MRKLCIISILLLITILCGCGNTAVSQDISSTITDTSTTKTADGSQPESNVVEIKNNQIFLNDIQLTTSSSKKSMPLISPDQKTISFISEISEDNIQLGIVDVKTKAEKNIGIDEEFIQITKMEWLSSQKLGMEMHVNPNLDIYAMFDIPSSKLINKYYGYSFVFNESKINILYMSAAMGEYKANLNNSVIYKAVENTKLDNTLYPSSDFNKVAFYEYNIEDESKSNIVILTLENNTVKSKDKIAWNKDTYELSWDNENMLLIGDIAKYDFAKSKLINLK